jgi:PAS domain S-box-containing protein
MIESRPGGAVPPATGTSIALRGADAPGGLLTDYRLQQRDYLLRIARAMNARRDLPDVLALVIRSAVTMTGGEAGAIAIRPPGGGEARVVATYRIEGRFEHDLEPILGDLASGRPAETDDGDASDGDTGGGQDRGRGEESGRDDPYHVLTLPLTLSDERVGQIVVFRSEGAAVFTPLDTQLLEAFADQAAVAIQNASLHERLAARERQLADIVERNPSGIVLADASGRVLAHNPAGRALTGRLSDTDRTDRLSDLLTLEDDAGHVQPLPLPGPGAITTTRGFLRTAGGSRGAFVQVTVRAIASPDGSVDSYVADVVDLSAYREAEDAKTAFLAGLSHELKTPLALIQGYAETLRLDEVYGDPHLFDESVDIILEEVGDLTRMVEELLLAARLQSGALSLDIDVVALGGMLVRIVDGFRRAEPDHEWRLDVARDVPPVMGDPLRLRQVFHNLLTNAAKYSPGGSPVHVTVREDAGAVVVTVRDAGIGIAPGDRARIFERFVRATRHAEGTGLGLYMSRAIVEAHGGRIEVDSEVGRGTTFTVFLPHEPIDPARSRPAPHEPFDPPLPRPMPPAAPGDGTAVDPGDDVTPPGTRGMDVGASP